jgi:hypothetical protein
LDNEKMLVGAVEMASLPDFNIQSLETRIDTGAKTSSLHVDNISEFEQDNKQWISFDIHPDMHNVDIIVNKRARVKAKRKIKSSNGTKETRYIIDTNIILGDRKWLIEVSLTDRSSMTYLMLLGREAMAGHIIVDPGASFLLTQ